jgi:serine/threonine protein kinase
MRNEKIPTPDSVSVPATGEHDSTWPDSSALGTTLLDKYEVLALFRGGFGVVLHVVENATGQPFAVKVPQLGADRGALILEQFKSEVEFWLHLPAHPNIVQAHFVAEIQGRPALFMEYVGGSSYNSLAKRLEAESIPENVALDLAYQLCVGMEFANRRGEIAHRDLKPDNLLISGESLLKLTDFGSAVQLKVVQGAYPKVTAGTWLYAAPEMLRREIADTRSDIYSFGMIARTMLTRQLPFAFELSPDRNAWFGQLAEFYSSREFRFSDGLGGAIPECSNRAVAQILQQCLAPEPPSRPRDFAQLLKLMNRALDRTQDSSPDRLATPEELFNIAVNLRRLGKYEEALTQLNLLLARYPDHPRRLEFLREAEETLKLNGLPDAARAFETQVRALARPATRS